jgi:uncharacterized protein (DUF2062 family)
MDPMSLLMLVCAVAASLAVGVLVAYVICQAMFRMFRLHAEIRTGARLRGAERVAVRG